MKIKLLAFYLIFLGACAQDIQKSPEENEKVDNPFGVDDYEAIIRHPVSLNEIIDSSDWSKITFENTLLTFDTIQEGIKIKKTYNFVNSGSKSLYILDTKVSCGCTITDYKKGAILPGESGRIDVQFDSSGKSGFQEKTIIVVSNCIPNEISLKLTGFVNKEI